MGSRRLPGKALLPLAGRSLLSHCLVRLIEAGVGPVIVATTALEEDEAIAGEAGRHAVQVVRGPVEDVLGRFALAIRPLDLVYVVRATGDNPVVDIDAARRVLAIAEAEDADHVVERNLPYGTAVEAVRAAALLTAARRAIDPYDREHVTPYLRRAEGGFRAVAAAAPVAVARPDLRLTVDTHADLCFMRDVLRRTGVAPRPVPLTEIIRAADEVRAAMEVA